MPVLPRNTATEDQRDVIDALSAVLDVEVKRLDIVASFPLTVQFDRVPRPTAVFSGGVWLAKDPQAAAVDYGFHWFQAEAGVQFTYFGLTADALYTVSLVAIGRRV